jgi:Lon protease-like protein
MALWSAPSAIWVGSIAIRSPRPYHRPVSDDPPRPLRDEELARLPVFPLPRLVFFPGTYLPLHLFEPRYRDMIEDCMGRGPRAMAVTMLEPGAEGRQELAQPPMKRVCGVGRIVAHEPLPNGTHNVVLAGVHRVQLEELPMGEVRYRTARATVLPDQGRARETDRLAMFSAASTVASIVRRDHPEFELGVEGDTTDGQAADLVADRLVSEAETRQALLETLDVGDRVRRVTDEVTSLLAMLSARGSRAGLVD